MFGFASAPRAGHERGRAARPASSGSRTASRSSTRISPTGASPPPTRSPTSPCTARLFVGPRVPIARFVPNAPRELAALRVTLVADGRDVEEGQRRHRPRRAAARAAPLGRRDGRAAAALADRRRRHRHDRHDHRRGAAPSGRALADAAQRRAFRGHDAAHDRMSEAAAGAGPRIPPSAATRRST